MSVGIGLIEALILLVACVLVIAALRKPSWLTLLALPVGMLLLLGIGSIMLAVLAGPKYRAAVPAAQVEQLPQRHFDQQPFTQPVESGWMGDVRRDLHAGTADVSGDIDSTVRDLNSDIDSTVRSLNSDLDSTVRDLERDVPGPVGLMRLFVVVPVILGIAMFFTIPILCRKWIARNAAVVIPIAGVTFMGLLVAGAVALYFVRWETREALRAQQVQELRALGESLHQRSFHEPMGGAISTSADEPGAPPQPTEVLVAAADVATADPAAAAAVTNGAATESPATPPAPELPEWARGETIDSRNLQEGVHRNPVVLKSDEWSSVQETEVQLEAMTRRAIQQQLQSQQGSRFSWEPSVDFIHQSGAIQQRFVEQTSLKVGEFESPMFRSYWQVAATPHVSSLAQAQWKALTIEHRLAWLGAAAAGLTLLFAGTAAGLRFDSATGGRYRRHLFAAIGFTMTMSAAMLLLS